MRELFSSRTATILTMVGVAVGLGNVWRFPYMMGSHGGSAFLFIYIVFVILFAAPALMGEWALGRETRSGPLGAFTAALGKWGRTVLVSIAKKPSTRQEESSLRRALAGRPPGEIDTTRRLKTLGEAQLA